MSNEKGVLRAVVVPALLAMAGVAAIVFFLTREEAEKPRSTPEPAAPAPVREPPAEAQPEPSAVAPAPSEPQAAPPPVADDVDAASAAQDAQPGAPDAGLISPELRRHALLMIPPTLLQAVENENLTHVRALRDQLAARRADNILTAADFEALDLIIECMEHAPDAREEGRDFLEFGATTIVRDALKRACE